jgi:general secretion pathway protein D
LALVAFLALPYGVLAQTPVVPRLPTLPGARGNPAQRPFTPVAAGPVQEPTVEVVTTEDGRSEKLIQLSFREAPLDQILEFYSQLTGRTMLKSPGINATITLKGQTKLTEDEALRALDAVMAMNNVALVPLGEKFYKVVAPTAVNQENKEIRFVEPEDGQFPPTDALVSQVIELKHMELSEVQSVIQGFIHGYGKITPLERANALLITDTSSNLQRISEILDLIDQPVEVKVEMRIYNIHNLKASEVSSKLNELIAESQEEKPAEQTPRVRTPAPPVPAGVIRANRPIPQAPSIGPVSADLAERGIISGKVKIIADDRTGIMFVFSRPENFVFFDRIIEVLDVSVEAEVVVRVEALEYADAEEIAGLLNEFIGAASSDAETPPTGDQPPAAETGRSQALRDFVARRAQARAAESAEDEAARFGQLSEDTRILADKRTNSLLLMGRKSDIAALEDMIDQLDVMLAQVLIETVIMEVDLRDGIAQGIDWLQRAFTVVNEDRVGPNGGLNVNQPVYAFGGGQRVLPDSPDFIDGATVGRGTTLGGALSYYMTFYDFNLDAVVRLAANSSDSRILSTPVIMTTDNTAAKLQVGEERPVVSSTQLTTAGSNRSTYEYRNIGINLDVTPRINPERFVIMEIKQTADDVGGTVQIDGNDVPIITKREFEAFVGVESRETIVMGGMVRTDARRGRTKVPLLGDIPLLGALFRSDSEDNVRTELMVMITPYVVLTQEEALQETRRLYESTRLPESEWTTGWSDSPLTTKPSSPGPLSRRNKTSRWSGGSGTSVEPGSALDLLEDTGPAVTPRISYGSSLKLKAREPVPEADNNGDAIPAAEVESREEDKAVML